MNTDNLTCKNLKNSLRQGRIAHAHLLEAGSKVPKNSGNFIFYSAFISIMIVGLCFIRTEVHQPMPKEWAPKKSNPHILRRHSSK